MYYNRVVRKRADGEGSIFKDSRGFWVAEFRDPSGKKVRKTSKKQMVVREWLQHQLAAVRNNTYIEDSKLTFGEFADRYIEDVAKVTLKPKTIETYSYILRLHIKPEIGNIRLSQLKPSHIQTMYSNRTHTGASKAMVNKIHAVTRIVLNHAVRQGLIGRNPTQAAVPPKPEKKTPETLSVEQLRKFFERVRGHRWYPIYCIAVGCGLRQGEVLGLRRKDVSLEEGWIKPEQAIGQLSGKTFIGTLKSDAAYRVVGMPDFVIDSLRELWANTPDDELLFRTSKGTPISPRNVLKHFQDTLDELGIPRVTFHSLRHTWVSLLLARKIPPKDVQILAGHSSFAVTMDIYGHMLSGAEETAARKLDGLV